MPAAATEPPPTIWGLTPAELHARFWASRGVQVVHAGEPTPLTEQAELYLLTDRRALTIFRVAGLLDTLGWLGRCLLVLRLRDRRDHGYREEVDSHPDGRFRAFRRSYGRADHRVTRVALTTDRETAALWQQQPDVRTAWRVVLGQTPRHARHAARVPASVYDAGEAAENARFVRDLAAAWKRPDATISRIRAADGSVWMDPTSRVAPSASVQGPLWIGAGRTLPDGAAAVGPAVVWDDPAVRPENSGVQWLDLEPLTPPQILRFKPPPPAAQIVKRAFDICFASLVLLLSAPVTALIALAVWLEDGRPVLFVHRRETIGGRPFGCIKFRSMRRDAEHLKALLAARNQADGPQFFIEDDPRLTRTGRFLRKYQLDELPQFVNVLRGEMSVVGPRPSPYSENQYCPGWREARLSVRPGVTGLWQVRRTRAQGSDFQEWIRYDIEYVERQSFWFDLSLIAQTAMMVIRRFINP